MQQADLRRRPSSGNCSYYVENNIDLFVEKNEWIE